jgi:hypothetical protein
MRTSYNTHEQNLLTQGLRGAAGGIGMNVTSEVTFIPKNRKAACACRPGVRHEFVSHSHAGFRMNT